MTAIWPCAACNFACAFRSAARAESSRARTCASSRRATTCPAVTVSPSRTVTSRIFPLVFGDTAESSPSMRPLSAMMLAGRLGVAKNIFQMTSAAKMTPAMRKILATRERGALFSADGGAPDAGGGVWCSAAGGGACVIVLVFSSSMFFSLTHFLQIRHREIRDMVRDAVQLIRREFQLRLQMREDRPGKRVEQNLSHDAVHRQPCSLVVRRQTNDLADGLPHAVINRAHPFIHDSGHRRGGLREFMDHQARSEEH